MRLMYNNVVVGIETGRLYFAEVCLSAKTDVPAGLKPGLLLQPIQVLIYGRIFYHKPLPFASLRLVCHSEAS